VDLSVAPAVEQQGAGGLAVAAARPDLLVVAHDEEGSAMCTTVRMSGLSTAHAEGDVATMISSCPDRKPSWALARSSVASPAW
jgi:hypothetical protein